MSDDSNERESSQATAPIDFGTGKITETITVPFSADMTPSQMSKVLRSTANVLHALISNMTRYASIGEGNNVGAGAQIMQQLFGAAGNVDAAARAIEVSSGKIVQAQLSPSNIISGGRA